MSVVLPPSALASLAIECFIPGLVFTPYLDTEQRDSGDGYRGRWTNKRICDETQSIVYFPYRAQFFGLLTLTILRKTRISS